MRRCGWLVALCFNMTGEEETKTGHKLRGRAQARPYKEDERRAGPARCRRYEMLLGVGAVAAVFLKFIMKCF
jgi:hypothetical protein